MIPARYMCTSSCQKLSLKSAFSGSMSVTSPFTILKPVGSFIQPLTEITNSEPGDAGDHDRDAAEDVDLRRQAVPAVDVDGDEDRLDEEREALQAEGEAEDVAEGGHELGPQQAELEGQDRAGHDPDGEQDDHRVRPALGECAVERVAGAKPESLEEQHHRREGDAEADQRDVDHERQRLHLTGLEQVLLIHRAAERAVEHVQFLPVCVRAASYRARNGAQRPGSHHGLHRRRDGGGDHPARAQHRGPRGASGPAERGAARPARQRGCLRAELRAGRALLGRAPLDVRDAARVRRHA